MNQAVLSLRPDSPSPEPRPHPYESLPSEAFWKTAVAEKHCLDIVNLSRPKRAISPTDLVATAGSCFAQHISRSLKNRGFRFCDVEPPPPRLHARHHARFGYGIFSARYGNVYTSAQYAQLYRRAYGSFAPREQVWVWNGRFYDPFRPSIEPGGFASAEEALRAQNFHLGCVRDLFEAADVFVFTLGLTEGWRSKQDGAVYPSCPGTQAGEFDPGTHEFVNLTYDDVMRDMRFVIAEATLRNPKVRFLLTVSPVPLTATASGQHVLVATTHSKAVLRAAAGQLREEFDNVDYFPSYEIVTAPPFGGMFFESNKREIHPDGVRFVMQTFLREFCETPPQAAAIGGEERDQEDSWCDEQGLEAFA